MLKTLIVAIAALGFGLSALPASAGQSSTASQPVKPKQGHSEGGGCSQEYPAPQIVKPTA